MDGHISPKNADLKLPQSTFSENPCDTFFYWRGTAPSPQLFSSFSVKEDRQAEKLADTEPALLASTARLYANEPAPTQGFFGMMSKDC